MKRILLVLTAIVIGSFVYGQSINSKLSQAYKIFESDSQLRSAISSLYVIESKTGKVVFDKNARVGMAPASTQKIITSATAYELLGKDFTYKTQFAYGGKIEDSSLKGSIYIMPSGDPTFGSWRWKSTADNLVLSRLLAAIKQLGIKKYTSVIVDGTGWEDETIPGGWVWEDIGNYYGAGAEKLNWDENQYDLVFQPVHSIGEHVNIKETKPRLYSFNLQSKVVAATKGTGDNTIIYFPVTSSEGIVRGTIPISNVAGH